MHTRNDGMYLHLRYEYSRMYVRTTIKLGYTYVHMHVHTNVHTSAPTHIRT